MSQSVIFQMWICHLTHREPSHRHGVGHGRATNPMSGPFFVDSGATSTVSEHYFLELRVQERSWSVHFYTYSEKQTP